MGLMILIALALMYAEKIWPVIVMWFIFLSVLCIWFGIRGCGNGD